MSFSRAQALHLLDTLPEMDFSQPVPGDDLTRAYLAHYRLEEISAPWPVLHCLGVFSSRHYRLACQYFAVPPETHRGTMVVVHGYYDHIGLFRHPIQFCLSRGYSVLAFDLPGHGLSSGDPASIGSFDHYSQALVDCLTLARRAEVPGPWQVLAQSTGAAAVINCLLKQAELPLGDLDKIMLLAPLVRPVAWHSGLLKYWLMRWFVQKVDREFAENSHDEAFLRFIASEDPLQARYLMVDWVRSLQQFLRDFRRAATSSVPLHIVQGTADTTVDWRYNLPALTARFPSAEVALVEGARHHLVNESEQYRQRVFAELERILGELH